MDIEIYRLILVVAIIFVATYVQSVSGFAFGIIAMIFLPSFLVFTEANVLSNMLSTITSALVVVTMLKKIHWKNIIFPLISSTISSYLAITFVKNAENKILTLLLGIALVLLSVYFFFFSDKIKIKPTWYAGLIAGLISGIMGGLFSISGPPVVIYFMQSEKDTDDYLATISAYFVISGIISVIMKGISGFITINVLIYFAVSLLGLLLGSIFGKKTRDKLDHKKMKKAVYGIMAVSGLVHTITSLI